MEELWNLVVPYHAGMLGQPESPRWLVQRNRRQDAEESARRLWGSEGASQLGETSTSGTLPCLAGSACCDTPQLGEHASTVIYPRYWLCFYSCHDDQCIAAPSTRLCWCMEEIVATPPQAACSACMCCALTQYVRHLGRHLLYRSIHTLFFISNKGKKWFNM